MSSEMNKIDRRVNRTRRQLRDALMALILERGYSAVKIEDITERADLGRTTFYLHYRDKEELLLESLEAIAEDLKAQVEKLVDQSLEEGSSQSHPVSLVFRHAEENRALYRIILKGEGSSLAASRIRQLIYDVALDFFSRRLGGRMESPPELPLEVVAGYFATALMGFITWWLEKELPYTSEEAADQFMELFFRGARQVLHIPS